MADNGYSGSGQRFEAPVGGWIFLLLIAAGALLLLLGSNALTGIEGDAAEGCRRLLGNYDVLSSAGWHPDSLRTIAYSRLLEPFVKLWGSSETILRLPSVIFALAMLIGTGVLAYEISGSARTALLSGWLLLGSYGFLFWGRCVHPAMLESCAILWGAVMLYRKKEMTPFLRAFLWFLLLLLLWLLDGVIGMVMLILFSLPVFAQEWKQRRLEMMPAAGAFLVTVPIAIGVTALIFRGFRPWLGWEAERQWLFALENALWQDAWARLCEGHFAQWWYSGAENVLRLILPWPILGVIAAAALWERRRSFSANLKNMMLSSLLIFCIFGIFPGRRWQSVLPLLPMLCAMIAGGLIRSGSDSGNRTVDAMETEDETAFCEKTWMSRLKTLMYWVCAFLGAVAVVLPVTWPVWQVLFRLPPPLSMMTLVPLLGVFTLAALIFSGERGLVAERMIGISGKLAGTVSACTALSVALLAVALPALTEFRTERNFLLKVRSRMHRDEKIVFVGRQPSSQALFYLTQKAEIPAIQDSRELKMCLQGVNDFGLIGRDEALVRSIIAESGVPVNLQKPQERENTPIRLFKTEDFRAEYCLWHSADKRIQQKNL